jgi:hypothetical protein
MRSFAIAFGILTFVANQAAADIYVLQIGDGVAPLSTSAAALTVQKFADSGGSPLASLAMPIAAGAGSVPNPIVVRGNSSTESYMHLSTNGQYLVMGGYGTTPGTATPDTAGGWARIVGRVQLSNFTSTGIDTTTALTDAFMGSSFRGVASVDGTAYWMGGNSSPAGSGGARYATHGASTSTQVAATPNNGRVPNIFNNSAGQPQLYLGSMSGAHVGVSTVVGPSNETLPTVTGGTATLLPGMSVDTGNATMDYWFRDPYTLYKADDRTVASGGGVQKWIAKVDGDYNGNNSVDTADYVIWGQQNGTSVTPGTGADGDGSGTVDTADLDYWQERYGNGTPSTWSLAYTLDAGPTGSPASARGLTGTVSGGSTILFATNFNGNLVTITDTGAGSVATLLASAPTNTAFRGVAYVPTVVGSGLGGANVPEPSSLALLLLGALPMCLRRRVA